MGSERIPLVTSDVPPDRKRLAHLRDGPAAVFHGVQKPGPLRVAGGHFPVRYIHFRAGNAGRRPDVHENDRNSFRPDALLHKTEILILRVARSDDVCSLHGAPPVRM
jgi:hypothetical protein